MVFIDANILIELIIPGRAKSKPVKNTLANYQEAAMSTLTAHLYWHFGRQAGVRARAYTIRADVRTWW